MTGRALPGASFVTPADGDKLFAPSAARNVEAICKIVQRYAPQNGQALEIASGTGQHIVAFAAVCPSLHWHPTEIDPHRRASIDAYAQAANLTNIAPSQTLNATQPGWGKDHGPYDFGILSNLVHLITDQETKHMLSEVGQALTPGGLFLIYGPFKRDGQLTSEGDAEFDAKLRAANPEVGYKDLSDVAQWAADSSLLLQEDVAMPANNLVLVLKKITA